MVVKVCITLRGRLFDFWAGMGGGGGGGEEVGGMRVCVISEKNIPQTDSQEKKSLVRKYLGK